MIGSGIGCLGAILCISLIFVFGFSIDESGGWINFFLIMGASASIFAGLNFDNRKRLDFGEEQKNKIINLFNNLDSFNPTQEFISPNLESAIAIDEDNKKVCIINNKHNNNGTLEMSSKFDYQSFLYSFSDIIQSEIIKDGVTITKTSRGSQIGGAIVGGVLAGGVGAIVGGLGASSESKSTTTNLQLQLVVNNAKQSVHKVIFMSPYDLGKFTTGDEMKQITHWHNLFTHILDRTNETISTNVDTPKISSSTADELKKLAELKNQGILTEEEFNQQKHKILSN